MFDQVWYNALVKEQKELQLRVTILGKEVNKTKSFLQSQESTLAQVVNRLKKVEKNIKFIENEDEKEDAVEV